jgi:hypothetical protein
MLGIVNTAGFGILFGAALFRTRDLWMPIGMHFAWNAVLPYLGATLSGLTIGVTKYRLVWRSGEKWSGGELWSGGKYGPEASLEATLVLLVLFFAIWKVPVRRAALLLLDGEPESQPSLS